VAGSARGARVRLLLDEHISNSIASELRRRYRDDVVAVTERDDLRGSSDELLLASMHAERRAIVSQNGADFDLLARSLVARGGEHYGIVLASRRTFPPSSAGIGRLVAALHRLLREHPEDDVLLNQTLWLEPA
jgi:hypothetical protein